MECETMASWLADAKKKPNALPTHERQQLTLSCQSLCRKIAREHVAKMAQHGRREEVDDCESEAFLACVEASQYYDPTCGVKFTTYSAQWIRTALLAWSNKQATQLAGGMEYPDLVADREVEIPDDIEVEIDARQRVLLAQLTEPDRTIVLLTHFAKQSPDRVATRLNLDVKDVKLRMRNAAGKLTSFMANVLEDSQGGLFGGPRGHEE